MTWKKRDERRTIPGAGRSTRSPDGRCGLCGMRLSRRKEEAMSREAKVKQLSRNQKDELVAHGPVERPIS